MILAAGGHVSWQDLALALVGGGLVSGSAMGLNCVWERDIDALMERTKHRPVPAGRLTPLVATIFSLVIGVLGFAVLWFWINPLSAIVALGGHLFYVFVYTIWLKRWTPQNIVIGGAAGAVPPLVGWVAATGRLELTAVLLFLIIFLWTPPHFWALALNRNEDYRRANVPMLPVVAGERTTHNQMLLYALLLLPTSIFLVLSNSSLGWLSLAAFVLLGSVFSWKIVELKSLIDETEDRRERKAWDVFGFSLIYLALFFVFIVLDATVI